MIDAQPRTPTLTPQEHRVRRAHLVVCCALLAALAVVYLTVAALVAGDLPPQVPVHFGVDGVVSAADRAGLEVMGRVESPLPGQDGNVEFFVWCRKRGIVQGV